MNSYTLSFNGRPIYFANSWQEAATAALKGGFATYALGVLFTLAPGATIGRQRRAA